MKKPGKRAFRVWYSIMAFIGEIFLFLFHPPVFSGKENIPDGAVVLCANHTKWYDPLLVGKALWPGRPLRYMAKAELFRSRILAFFLFRMGMFPVVRGTSDLSALKTAVGFLKNGEAVLVFPEGTRTKTDGQVRPKAGAVKISQWAGTPIVPIYIPKKRRLFCRIHVVIGEPYRVNPGITGHRELAQDLMTRIYDLKKAL